MKGTPPARRRAPEELSDTASVRMMWVSRSVTGPRFEDLIIDVASQVAVEVVCLATPKPVLQREWEV